MIVNFIIFMTGFVAGVFACYTDYKNEWGLFKSEKRKGGGE
jgi:hypothetical protein